MTRLFRTSALITLFMTLAFAAQARIEGCEGNQGLDRETAIAQAPAAAGLFKGDSYAAIVQSPLCPQELFSILQHYDFVGDGVKSIFVDEAKYMLDDLILRIDSGQSSSTFQDRDAPTISTDGTIDVTINADQTDVLLPFNATALDEVGGIIQPQYAIAGGGTISSPHRFAVGRSVIMVTAQDGSGNTSQEQIPVIVRQRSGTPRIVVSPRITQKIAPDTAIVDLDARAFDGNGRSIAVSYSLPNGRAITPPFAFPIGTTTVTASAVDANGNSVSERFDVVVQSDEPALAKPSWHDLPNTTDIAKFGTVDPEEWIVNGQYVIELTPEITREISTSDPFVAKAQLGEVLGINAAQIQNYELGSMAHVVVAVSADEITRIRNNSAVEDYGQDYALSLFDDGEAVDETAEHSAVRDWIDRRDRALDGQFNRAAEIQDVTVYVVDTGIRDDHATMRDKITGWRGVAAGVGGNAENVCNAHGTAMASLIGGNAYGVAGRVNIVDVNVASCGDDYTKGQNLRLYASDIAQGLRWIKTQEARRRASGDTTPAVINMSLGAPSGLYLGRSNPELKLTTSIQRALTDLVDDYGAIVIAAAGNAGKDACYFTPGYMAEVVTVGAVDTDGNMLDFSNYGPCLDSVALGNNQTTADSIGQTTMINEAGTSGAAAIVSGVAAHLLATGLDRDLVNAHIRTIDGGLANHLDYARNLPPLDDTLGIGTTASLNAVTLEFGKKCLVNTNDGILNIREAPELGNNIASELRNGDVVTVVGQHNRWVKISFDHGFGYAAIRGSGGIYLHELDGASECEIPQNLRSM